MPPQIFGWQVMNKRSDTVSFICYMRHIQLKHLWGCWQVKVLQELEKITTVIQAGVPLMYKWHILCGKNSLGCCLNHYAAASCTSSHMNLQPVRAFCNVPEMWKLYGGKSRLWCIMTEHFTSKCGIQLVLELCGPNGDGQQDDDVSEFTLTVCFVLGLAFEDFDSNGLHWWCQPDCESRSRGPQCPIGQRHFTGGCLCLEFLWLGWNGSSLHCLSANFPMGTIVWYISSHATYSTFHCICASSSI